MNRTCFVISPIGEEGSSIREHADDVFDFIIKPAMEKCGIDARRSDHLHEPGRITEQMLHSILNDDLCIAILKGFNPNVFYELAIAQCAGRPVILMAERGQDLPFDVQDLRCVFYDLRPRPLFKEEYVEHVVQHVQCIVAAEWKSNSLISGLIPLPPSNDPAAQFLFVEKTRDYFNRDVLVRIVQETILCFDAMAYNPHKLLMTKSFGELLIDKASKGCKVRILIMDKSNPALPYFINPAISGVTQGTLEKNLEDSYNQLLELTLKTDNIQIRRMSNGCAHFRLARTDQTALMVPYLYSDKADYTPLWQSKNGSTLYAMACKEFETLWLANNP